MAPAVGLLQQACGAAIGAARLLESCAPQQQMSSSSGSDSSDEDDEALEREVSQLQSAIAANPNAYDSYLQLIAAQRKIGDLDGVRAAREQMAAVFPLTADIWMPWLEDEARLASTEAERRAVLGLYDRAVGDYLSMTLWLAFCAYAEEAYVVHGLPGGLDAVRAVYERALAEAGLHFALGAELWARFRAFERRVAEASGGGQDRVLVLFRKQLRLPMAGLASVRVEFEQSIEGQGSTEAGELGGDTALQRDHARALKGADARARFENALVEEQFATQPTQAQLAPWLDYIQFEAEQSGSSHVRTLFVYERAVSCWPLSLELWLAYTGFAEGSAARAVTTERMVELYARAVRNIGWSGTLWCGYLRNLQQAGHPDEAIQAEVQPIRVHSPSPSALPLVDTGAHETESCSWLIARSLARQSVPNSALRMTLVLCTCCAALIFVNGYPTLSECMARAQSLRRRQLSWNKLSKPQSRQRKALR